MGLMALNKGKSAEREVVNILKPIIAEEYARAGLPPVDIKRNLSQTQNGGYDIEGIGWLALEVKRQESLNLNGWWKQAVEQTGENQTTVLIYRQNNKPWSVQMMGAFGTDSFDIMARADISLNSFLHYFKYRIREQVESLMGEKV